MWPSVIIVTFTLAKLRLYFCCPTTLNLWDLLTISNETLEEITLNPIKTEISAETRFNIALYIFIVPAFIYLFLEKPK